MHIARHPAHRVNALSLLPEPSPAKAVIAFDLPKTASVTLIVYDISGRMVRTVVDETLPTSEHKADVNTFELRRVPTAGGGGLHEYLTARFAPDDGKIAYDPATGVTGERQIYIIDADGTDDTWVGPGGRVDSWGPSFSPMRADGVLLDTYGRVIEE
ncbi:MAG: hypothetical protein JSW52_06325 [Candidatus Coatesbacteria bacterium]|nr:MAG: hypothetical protein JSW52_06325 [Candidatus Coatesbacteria bacterium]